MGEKLKSFTCNFILLLSTIILFLISAEIVTRIVFYLKSQKSFKDTMKDLPVLESGNAANLADIIKPSKFPDIIYELKPNLKVNYLGIPLETNAAGWRGKLYPLNKDKDVVRIIGG